MAAHFKFRVRRGFGGVCVLQQLTDYPSLICGRVDSSIRRFEWVDVRYDNAPPLWEPIDDLEPRESPTNDQPTPSH